MKSSKIKGVSGEIQLTDLDLIAQDTSNQSSGLLDTQSPKKNLLNRSNLKWGVAISSIFLLSLWQTLRNLSSLSISNPLASAHSKVHSNPLFSKSVEMISDDYSIIGSFDETLCRRSSITVTASMGSPFQNSHILKDNCQFKLIQKAQVFKFAYSQDGIMNVVDLRTEIFGESQTLNLGQLPLLSKEQIITRTFFAADLVSGEAIDKFRVVVKGNHKEHSQISSSTAVKELTLTFANGYYTAIVEAEGYQTVIISSSDLLKLPVQSVYLLKKSATQNMISLKDTQLNTLGLRAEFTQNRAKCIVDQAQNTCTGVQFISRLTYGTFSSEQLASEFIVFDATEAREVTPKVYAKESKSHARVLQESSQTSRSTSEDSQTATTSGASSPSTQTESSETFYGDMTAWTEPSQSNSESTPTSTRHASASKHPDTQTRSTNTRFSTEISSQYSTFATQSETSTSSGTESYTYGEASGSGSLRTPRVVASIEVSGYFTESSTSASSTNKESRGKVDWRTGSLKQNPWDKTVNVNTVMSNYLIFSPNITCYRPTVLDNEELKAVKVKGSGGAFWYVVSYNRTEFVVVTDGVNHPSEIRMPSGVVVQILTNKARRVSQHRDVFAIVTTKQGTYFNIADNTWQKIATLPVAHYSKDLPNAEFLSSNAINIGTQLHGGLLLRQVLSIPGSPSLTSLLALLSSKDADRITGKVYSSWKGFQLVKLPSYTDKGKFDTYRVCIYCLKKEMRRTMFQYTAQNITYNAQNIRFIDFLKNNQLFEAFFAFAYHMVPHNTFVDHEARESLVVYTISEVGEIKTLSKDDLDKILRFQLAGKLNNLWLKEKTVDRLRLRHFKNTVVIKNEKIYVLMRNIVSDYMMEDPSYYEPALYGVISATSSGRNYGLDNLFIEDPVIYQVFLQGRAVPGLFIKSTNADVMDAWPFVLGKEDQVINKYHINVAMIRKVYAMQPNTVDNYNHEPFATSEAEDLLNKFRPVITRENEDADLLANRHVVYFNNKEIELSNSCIQAFYEMKVPGSFKKIDTATYRLRNNKFYIQFGNQIYIYSFEPMRQKLLTTGYSDQKEDDIIHKCLQMDVVSSDANLLRVIWVNDTDLFEGYCQGKFVNDSFCVGTFRGKYRAGCESDDQRIKCESTIKDFTCLGKIDSTGCNQTYSQPVTLNQTTAELMTTGRYSVVGSTITSFSTIKVNSKELNVDTQCIISYTDSNKECVKAIASVSKNRINHLNFTVRCDGVMNAETFECRNGIFDLLFCEQEQHVDTFDICKGNYINRHCENGGNFQKCFTKDLNNQEQVCFGGIWDGITCKERPLYIIADNYTYYTGKCEGTYLTNSACIGTFTAQVVTCDYQITPDNLCTNVPVDSFICTGKTTKHGCSGSYRSNTTVGDSGFIIIITDSQTPINQSKSTNTGTTTMYLLKTDGSSNVKDIKVTCNSQYDNENKLCMNAFYEKVLSQDDSILKEIIACQGTLNLVTLECDSRLFDHSRCLTKYPNIATPFCNGTFDSLKCMNGGSIDTCKEVSKFNSRIHCENGLWNGKFCRVRPLYIIINNAAYVTGECQGDYKENQACQGTMNGKVILCKPGLTPDNLCEGPVVDEFVCDGTLTKYGCQGQFTGKAKLRDAFMNLATDPNIIISLSKVLTSGHSRLDFSHTDEDYERMVGDGYEYSWEDIHADCSAHFSDVTKTCGQANLGGVMRYDNNRTYIELSCQGNLQMHPVICDSGEYMIKHCNTSILPYDPQVCNGTYTELSCADGGNLTDCFGETKPLVDIYCNGTYSNGVCEGFVPPTFSIIKVNSTHWLRGLCSSYILNNACTGLFEQAQLVNCHGDPLNNQEDYESCTPISGESFGSCDGVTNSSGCFGNYIHPLNIDSKLFQSQCIEEGNNVYDFETYNCVTSLKPVDLENEAEITCDVGFNPKAKKCPNGKGMYLLRHVENQRPGIVMRREFSCEGANLYFHDFTCRATYMHSACYGKPITKRDGTVTCLGDFVKVSCADGGSENGCSASTEDNIELFCIKSYFDGHECVFDKMSENTDIVIHRLNTSELRDAFDRPVKVAEFEIDGFTMENAEVESADLFNSVIKAVRFENAEQDSDGNFVNIKVLDNVKNRISLDEGHLNEMVFRGFLLDELQYTKFAVDDTCKLVHIKFNELTIHNVLFQNFVCKNTVIRNLQWAQSSAPDYGVEEVNIDIGFGTVILRNVEVYLPYISRSVIDEWRKSRTSSKVVSVVVPKIPDIEVPFYKIHFNSDQSDIYLEFPEFKIEDKSIDLIYMADYVLDSTKLVSKQDIVSQILEGYQEDPRLTSLEQEETVSSTFN